jgi:diguanylate cyclase (GGDEF)-like protein
MESLRNAGIPLTGDMLTEQYPVLIVDDDPDMCILLEDVLCSSGHKVTCVSNGRDALACYNSEFHPIVISDWRMPEMDGLTLCRSIRSMNTDNYTYIVLLTAKNSKQEIITGLEAGADDYLSKPFHRAELLARLSTGKRILGLERSLRRANEEVKQLSITDPLTGCYNRGYVAERIPKEIERARRYNKPLSLIMTDIDHFKQINDKYGHHSGDLVLIRFVNLIKNRIREGADWLARFGGEEFVLFMTETPPERAYLIAERMRSVIEDTPFETAEHEIKITASFGVTGVNSDNVGEQVSLEMLLHQADALLYTSKQTRNCVSGSSL